MVTAPWDKPSSREKRGGGRAGRAEERLNRTESRCPGAAVRDLQQRHRGTGMELEELSAAQQLQQAAVNFVPLLASQRARYGGGSYRKH